MARILIIEDDGDLVQLLSLALFKSGYEAHYAFNGKEGYDKVLTLHPDLIVMDLRMPVMAGTDVLKLLTHNVQTRDIPVIVMTAYGDEANLLELSIKAQGARAYIRKPFQLKELVALVRRTLKESPPGESAAQPSVAKGAVRLDPRFRTLWINDQRVATLSEKRCELIRLLLEAKGPVKRAVLLDKVWGESGTQSGLEKTIQRLREDLGPENAPRLQTRPDGYELLG